MHTPEKQQLGRNNTKHRRKTIMIGQEKCQRNIQIDVDRTRSRGKCSSESYSRVSRCIRRAGAVSDEQCIVHYRINNVNHYCQHKSTLK